MLVGGIPISEIVIVRHFGFEVFQEALLTPVPVKKAELLVDDGFGSPALDEFRIAEHGLVELRFKLLCRVGIYVYAEILPPCRFAGLRVSDRRVKSR